jgi:hypothetical protein
MLQFLPVDEDGTMEEEGDIEDHEEVMCVEEDLIPGVLDPAATETSLPSDNQTVGEEVVREGGKEERSWRQDPHTEHLQQSR